MGAGSMASGSLGKSVASGAAGGAAAGVMGGPVGMAIGAGIGALGSIFGAKVQSGASKKASQFEYDAQTRALDEAKAERDYNRSRDEQARADALERQAYERRMGEEGRDYSRGQYANYLGRLAPFSEGGTRAFTGLTRSLPGVGQMAAQVGSGPMVQIQAPNGQVRPVPASQRDYWISKGGKVVG